MNNNTINGNRTSERNAEKNFEKPSDDEAGSNRNSGREKNSAGQTSSGYSVIISINGLSE